MYPARLDDKGRLRLPVPFQRYLGSLPDKRLFVTSLDRRIATVYTLAAWKENEKLFDGCTDEPDRVENVAFNANDLGSETELDAQGRIQFSTELRRELRLEDQPVHMQVYKGGIQVMSEPMYQAKKMAASRTPEDDVRVLRLKGLK
jgi:DNA-binding transcriptional regulator/RsmH inhibitor MraZ